MLYKNGRIIVALIFFKSFRFLTEILVYISRAKTFCTLNRFTTVSQNMFHNELRYVNMFVYHYNARLLSTDHSHFADWYKKVERKENFTTL